MRDSQSLKIFAGNATPVLAQEIATELGVSLGDAIVGTFSDGETRVELQENVRGQDVFVIQSTSAPTNENLMELLIMVDALHRASAKRITAVIPYFGYARQDRRVRSRRVPISAKLVADMLKTSGVDRVLTIDLHSDQIQGFFNQPVDNIYATGVLKQHMEKKSLDNLMVVSPDVGGVVRARALAKHIGDLEMAIIDKRRPEPNVSAVMHIIGDVAGKDCILIDDMVDTAGTICHAADALKEHGAKSVTAYATHPVFSGNAVDNIENSSLDEIVVTNTIELSDKAKQCKKIMQLSVANIFATTIQHIHCEKSVSDLFAVGE